MQKVVSPHTRPRWVLEMDGSIESAPGQDEGVHALGQDSYRGYAPWRAWICTCRADRQDLQNFLRNLAAVRDAYDASAAANEVIDPTAPPASGRTENR